MDDFFFCIKLKRKIIQQESAGKHFSGKKLFH